MFDKWNDFTKLIDRTPVSWKPLVHVEKYTGIKENDQFVVRVETNYETQVLFTNNLIALKENSSFGLELYFETNEFIENTNQSWQLKIIHLVGALLINQGQILQLIQREEYLSLQMTIRNMPSDWSLSKNKNGNVGIFVGMKHEDDRMEAFFEHSKYINIKLMRPAELDFVLHMGKEGRLKLAELYQHQRGTTISSLHRPSVIYYSKK